MAFFIYMNIENENEIWKDVPTYEGLYQVSSFGRVKSLIKWNGTNERILNLQKGSTGYLKIVLCKNTIKTTFKVHQVVAMAFYGHVRNGFKIVVDHKDNNKLNNRADNLRLTTNRDNATKDLKSGTSKYIGVSYNSSSNKWISCIRFKGTSVYLGLFDIEIEASNAYQKALKEWEQGLDLNILYPKWRSKSSKYKWISWSNNKNKWEVKYKRKFIGLYNTEEETYEVLQKYIANLPVST